MYLRRFKPGKTSKDIDEVLRFVIRSASIHIPSYRDLLERCGVSASGLRRAADLPMFPTTEKQSMFHDLPLGDQMHDRADPSRSVRTSTSGFTGMPISIYMSRAEAFFRRSQVAAAWRGVVRLPPLLRVADLGTWVTEKSGHVLVRRGPVSILRVSLGLPVDLQIRLLTRFDPHVISGASTALDLLARGLAETPFAFCSVRLAAARGEVLFAAVRTELEEAFGCRVADFYNCEEIGNVASECPVDPNVFHVNTDACIVETVDDGGRPVAPSEEGRILLTNLYNCTMPFIRYDIRDRGTLLPLGVQGSCACGSRRPRMKLLGGREDDYVFLPSGRRVSPRLVGTAVYRAAMDPMPQGGVRWLFRGFQVVQDALDHMTVRVIPEPDRSVDLEERLTRALLELHPAFRCTVMLVDDLPHEPSGKLKKVICSIEPGRRS